MGKGWAERVRWIDLSRNPGLGDEGVEMLTSGPFAETLERSCPSLHSLDLRLTGIGLRGANLLSSYLQEEGASRA